MTDLPISVDAEQALIGAILLNNEAFWRVSEFLTTEDFSEPLHGEIYAIMAGFIRGGRNANTVNVAAKLPTELTEDMTMLQYLSRLVSEAPTVINAPDYGHVVREMSQRRTLIQIGETIRAGALATDAPLPEVIEDAEQSIFALANVGSTRSRTLSFGDAASEALEMASRAYSRDGSLAGISTGLKDLDGLMGGMQDSDLIILAARPAMGKTSLATNIAFHVARTFVGEAQPDGSIKPVQGGRVGFFSLEMSAEQLATRILAEQAGIPSSVIRRGAIHERQFDTLAQVSRSLSAIPLYIEDAGALNVGQLCGAARRLKRQKGLDLVVVDYLQLLSGTTRRSGENRVQEITEITTKLKALAKELAVPVLVLSQLSRQVEQREDKHPQLSDLRESGSIEQDADVVMFIYREEYYLKGREPKEGSAAHVDWQAQMDEAHGIAEIIIGKQRHGPTGTVTVAFDANLTRFTDLARPQYLPERFGEGR